MIGLLQRVSEAHVDIDGETIARIGQGLLVLIGVQPDDSEAQASRLLERLLGYRVFADPHGRMNLSLRDVRGGLLLVPQFTLPADTRSGTRPGFSTAAPAEPGHQLFTFLEQQARAQYPHVGCGRFGADMQVALVNDGPVTFWIEAH